ncbi:MAG: hypothetical protein Q7K43_05470 [Candidatus Woesearchaeota archaeon]|nr:hypothetical protein [Candidatus Woesearchaeota archaeon]
MKKQYSAQEARQKIKQYFTQAHLLAGIGSQEVQEKQKEQEGQEEQKGQEEKILIQKARKLAMKHRLKMPKEFKRQYCTHCYTLFIPGKNYRVRTTEGSVVYTCLSCRRYIRFSYTAQQKIKRNKKL